MVLLQFLLSIYQIHGPFKFLLGPLPLLSHEQALIFYDFLPVHHPDVGVHITCFNLRSFITVLAGDEDIPALVAVRDHIFPKDGYLAALAHVR